MMYVTYMIVMILSFSWIYFLAQLVTDGKSIKYYLSFPEAIYFSIVTWTTLGYGDLKPLKYVKYIAAIEAFLGYFFMAIFIALIFKKLIQINNIDSKT